MQQEQKLLPPPNYSYTLNVSESIADKLQTLNLYKWYAIVEYKDGRKECYEIPCPWIDNSHQQLQQI